MTKSEIQKTLAKIECAKNVTENFLNRTQKIAEFIRQQMETLGLKEILKGKYIIDETIASGQSSLHFSLIVTAHDFYEYPVSLTSNEVSPTRELKFYGGDYNAKYYLPNRHDLLIFIEDIPKIMTELGNYDNDSDFDMLDDIISVIEGHPKAA